jgi:hypothetical protein
MTSRPSAFTSDNILKIESFHGPGVRGANPGTQTAADTAVMILEHNTEIIPFRGSALNLGNIVIIYL